MRWVALIACLALAGCEEEAPEITGGTFGPELFQQQQTLCEETGGRWGRGGLAGFVCYREPPDAGRQCRAESDCTSLCLARSGTCAPVAPFFGCHEVLTDTGARATVCID